jgi:outer membrane receptor protein involved in Fe transport
LRPERVRNAEVSAGWEAGERTAVQLSGYQARYSGVIAITELPSSDICPEPCRQNQNRDEIRVRGLEATARHRIVTARHKIAAAEIWANYTHVQPVQRVPSDADPDDTQTVRVPNIATNQINAGADVEWRRLTAAIRTHYSGRRRIGRGTAFITHPGNRGDEVDAYSTTALTLTYRDVLPKVTAQVTVDNLFDKQYWAVGSETLPSVLQNGRTLSVRIIYGMK